jgi:hypothetical protein
MLGYVGCGTPYSVDETGHPTPYFLALHGPPQRRGCSGERGLSLEGSDHPSAQAAVTAASAATERLADILAALEQAAEEIAAYNEHL